MADITITAGNVLKGTGAKTRAVRYGGTITAGMAVYEDTSDSSDCKAADCDASSTTAAVAGIALNGGADGQPGEILTEGPITIGGTAVVGTIYVLSGNAGGIAPSTDLAQNDYVSVIGVGISATQIYVKINNSGVQVP